LWIYATKPREKTNKISYLDSAQKPYPLDPQDFSFLDPQKYADPRI